jgi:hypothetical protein
MHKKIKASKKQICFISMYICVNNNTLGQSLVTNIAKPCTYLYVYSPKKKKNSYLYLGLLYSDLLFCCILIFTKNK